MEASFYTYIDALYQQGKTDKAEEYMLSCLAMAERESNSSDQITVLNELIGLYRVQGRFTQCKQHCERLLALAHEMEIENTLPYATTLLNVANAYRVMELYNESENYFLEVESIYHNYLGESDFRIASLYNNLSLVYQAQKNYEKAAEALEKALGIVGRIPDAYIEHAVTHTNLANVLLDCGRTDKALEHLAIATDIFEMNLATSDMHYSATLSTRAYANYRAGNYEAAISYYRKAAEIIELTSGRTKNYATMFKNIANVYEKTGQLSEAKAARAIADEVLASLEN